MTQIMRPCFFLHGLDSSSQGTKGRWFSRHFPEMRIPDFSGSLEERLEQLARLCGPDDQALLVGSSFGGLMATIHAQRNPGACSRLILLAPALNFEAYQPPPSPIQVPTLVIIGQDDVVTPPELVLPLVRQSFAAPEISLVADDHMLHTTFPELDWPSLLAAE
ncbi:alpha/beta hydrolase [Desulfogranum mediterraneum]|uniref:alpha/beta hydrolase n=1 Tax=Desulfogranum mediterraneum TaxID=160661 RepID=UPI0004140FA3|nr:alpha/beta hydrolase [Desulfogranum mediterraneum]